MPIRYPEPLRPGDRICVTSPSSGVPDDLMPRLEFCVDFLRGQGFEVVVGTCMAGDGVSSASAPERAAELQAMLTHPGTRAVVPPWGGHLAVELLPHLDFDALGEHAAWFVGFSDNSTLQFSITVLTGVATLHGQNLMDTPYRVPEPLLPWRDVAATPAGARLVQGAARRYRAEGYDPWQDEPTVSEFSLDTPGGWRLLTPDVGRVDVSGRLIGGCIETISVLAGTPYGDLPGFADREAPDGLLLYLEAAEEPATSIARHLWRMRLAGWFDRANAVLIGRTRAPGVPGFSQDDAVRSALGDLDVPVVLDVDCGHVPPHLSLVNGASARIVVSGAEQTLSQELV